MNTLRDGPGLLFQVMDSGPGLRGVNYRKLFDPNDTAGQDIWDSIGGLTFVLFVQRSALSILLSVVLLHDLYIKYKHTY